MDKIFNRTIGLIGEEKFNKIHDKTLAIFGLGGVGGTAFEALVRTGFDHFVICDFDNVDETNLNRQILYTAKDIGLKKVECATKRAREINSDVSIEIIGEKLSKENIQNLDKYKIDFVIDAIDDSNAKIALATYCLQKDIPMIMSLGMACRVDPSKVGITKLNKTTSDPLAKKMRYEIKKLGLDTSKINVAFSSELRMTEGVELNSVMFVPSSAGLNIANYVFSYLINN